MNVFELMATIALDTGPYGTKYDNLSTLAEDLMIEMQFAYDRHALVFG